MELQKHKNTIFGVFQNRSLARKAVETLKEERFQNDDICVLMPSGNLTIEFANEKGTHVPGYQDEDSLKAAIENMGIPKYEAKHYESCVRNGGVLLSVKVNNPKWEKKAKSVFRSLSAIDVSNADEDDAQLIAAGALPDNKSRN